MEMEDDPTDDGVAKHTEVIGGVPYSWWITKDGKTFAGEFNAPQTLRLHPEYEAMVVDLYLGIAHRNMLVPVGSFFITDEDNDGPPTQQLEEGVTMRVGAPTHQIPSATPTMRVRAEVSLVA